MYNVIVVDDETWICKLIRKIVDWDAIGFNIIANASDGFTALELIEKHKPDLVITDIRMPGLDGIGLIKAAREKKLDIEFIIVSGYSDFEYARSALAYDAFAYILKPLDRDEFEEVLYSVKDKISKKNTIKVKLESSETAMLESDLRKIIDKTNKGITAESLNRKYNTKFMAGPNYTVIFKQDFISKDNINDDYQYFLSKIKRTHADAFQEKVYFPGNAEDQTIFILNLKNDADDVYKLMRKIMQAFDGEDFSKSFTLTICIGLKVNTINEIDVSYESAANAMKARVFLGAGRVIDANKEAGRIIDAKNIIDIRVKKKLSVLFDVFDMENASKEIKRILFDAEKKSTENLLSYHTAAYEIIEILFESMESKGIKHKSGISRQQAFASIDGFCSVKEIEDYISSLIKEFQDAYLDEKHNNGEKLITEIKRFISENYMSNINLEDVAKLVCLSPTYVSEIFKRKTGENFSEYLIDYRIEIAKDMLKDIRYKVVDISQMVGYADSKYFSRLFKKKVGVNPRDYRKLCL
jgi:two-component system response regulator YesN